MSVLLLFVGMACTMLCIMIKDSSGASCSSTDLATSVSLTSGVVCQDATSISMACTILGTTASVWSSDIDRQSFLVRAQPGSSKVLSVTKTLSCNLTVSWVYDNNIQTAMTCWSPGGWAGMNGTNITCLSDNTASCSAMLSVSNCSRSASSPANTPSSPANTPSSPATTPSVTKNTTSISNYMNLGGIIGGITAGGVILLAVAVASGFICWYVCRKCKKNAAVDITVEDTTLMDTNTTLDTTVDTIQMTSQECTTKDDPATINMVIPKVPEHTKSHKRALRRDINGSNEEERTGEDSNASIKPMQTYCDPLNQARDHGSGNPPSGGPSIQEVSGSEAPSLAVHAPPPVLFAVPPGGQMVPVQPGHGKECIAIDMAQVEHTSNILFSGL